MNDSKLYKWVEFIYKLIILNFVYFFAILLGFGVAGIFPATLALIKVITNFEGNEVKDLLKEFFVFYKKSFIKANLWGYTAFTLFVGAYINYQVLVNSHFFIFNILGTILLLLTSYLVLSGINGLYIKQLKEELTYKKAIIDGCIYTFVNISYSLTQISVLIGYYFLITQFPVVFLFSGSTLLTFILFKILKGNLKKVHHLTLKNNL